MRKGQIGIHGHAIFLQHQVLIYSINFDGSLFTVGQIKGYLLLDGLRAGKFKRRIVIFCHVNGPNGDFRTQQFEVEFDFGFQNGNVDPIGSGVIIDGNFTPGLSTVLKAPALTLTLALKVALPCSISIRGSLMVHLYLVPFFLPVPEIGPTGVKKSLIMDSCKYTPT